MVQNKHEKTDGMMKMLMVSLAGDMFAIDITDVSDVMARVPKTDIPMALPVIDGVMNLRGQIVTEINMARVMDMPMADSFDDQVAGYAVVLTRGGEHYSLAFDRVYGVVDIAENSLENIPETINPAWRPMTHYMCRYKNDLVTLIDLQGLFDTLTAEVENALSRLSA